MISASQSLAARDALRIRSAVISTFSNTPGMTRLTSYGCPYTMILTFSNSSLTC